MVYYYIALNSNICGERHHHSLILLLYTVRPMSTKKLNPNGQTWFSYYYSVHLCLSACVSCLGRQQKQYNSLRMITIKKIKVE